MYGRYYELKDKYYKLKIEEEVKRNAQKTIEAD